MIAVYNDSWKIRNKNYFCVFRDKSEDWLQNSDFASRLHWRPTWVHLKYIQRKILKFFHKQPQTTFVILDWTCQVLFKYPESSIYFLQPTVARRQDLHVTYIQIQLWCRKNHFNGTTVILHLIKVAYVLPVWSWRPWAASRAAAWAACFPSARSADPRWPWTDFSRRNRFAADRPALKPIRSTYMGMIGICSQVTRDEIGLFVVLCGEFLLCFHKPGWNMYIVVFTYGIL